MTIRLSEYKVSTAYHEAGHAVVSELSKYPGLEVDYVTIIPDERGYGHIKHVREDSSSFDVIPDEDALEAMREEYKMKVAGLVSEYMAYTRGVLPEDSKRASEWWVGVDGQELYRILIYEVRVSPGMDSMPTDWWNKLDMLGVISEVGDILRDRWEVVTRLAELLQREGTITGEQVRQELSR